MKWANKKQSSSNNTFDRLKSTSPHLKSSISTSLRLGIIVIALGSSGGRLLAGLDVSDALLNQSVELRAWALGSDGGALTLATELRRQLVVVDQLAQLGVVVVAQNLDLHKTKNKTASDMVQKTIFRGRCEISHRVLSKLNEFEQRKTTSLSLFRKSQLGNQRFFDL